MTVDPATSRKHTVTIIEKTMSEIGFNVKADRLAKAQALELIKKLSEEGSPLSVRRVRMRVRVTMSGKDAKRIKEKVMLETEELEKEETGAEWEAVRSQICLAVSISTQIFFVSGMPVLILFRRCLQIVHINPSSFRILTDMVNDETKGKGRVESMGSVGG